MHFRQARTLLHVFMEEKCMDGCWMVKVVDRYEHVCFLVTTFHLFL